MNIYRDRVTVDGKSYRASVWVLSTTQRLSGNMPISTTVLSISLPASADPERRASRVIWRGVEYLVQGTTVPIMALGRLDHWELTAALGEYGAG